MPSTRMTYGDFKDLTSRTASDKVLKDKAFNIAKNPKCDGYQRQLASMVYNFFDKKSDKSVSGSGVNIPLEFNEQLAEELQKPIPNLKEEKYILGLDVIFWVLI